MLNTEKLKTEFFMSDSELFDFLQISKESLKVDLKNFETALVTQNEKLLKKTAHKLKSGFNYLNLTEVANVFDQIQNAESLHIDLIRANDMYQSCKKDIGTLLYQIDTLKPTIH